MSSISIDASTAMMTDSLTVGDDAPSFVLPDVRGSKVSLADVLQKGRAALVFYRGGWCPICNRQLAELSGRYDEFQRRGVEILALAFSMAGAMKSMTPIDELATKMPWVTSAPILVRFIGISELLGAIGLILPGATRIHPKLTAYAGAGIAVIMVLGTAFHISRGEVTAIPITLVLGCLAGFVIWGRLNKAPIIPRGRA